MTINATATILSYDGNGSTTAFPVSFQFFGTTTTAELKVIEVTISTGAEVLKTNGSDYTVSGGNGLTGTITASTAPASGKRWVIIRNTTNSQNVDYVANDPFSADTHERALDRLASINQEQDTILAKTLKTPEGFVGTFNGNIPNPIAGRGLQFNSSGNGLEVTEAPIADIINTATTKANEASASASTATTKASEASSSLNSIQRISLGSKSSAPTVDNNGNALVAGVVYYDTTTSRFRVYTGTTWQNVAGLVSSASDLTTGTVALARLPEITTGKLADDAVTTAKIADDSVTLGKMANNSVGENELIDGSVTLDKIADGAVGLPTSIFTATTGKFFTRNTDGSLPTGITSANVWSLTAQAGGGAMPSGKNHIELPLKVSGTLAGGGGGASAYYGGSDGGDTTFLGITAQGGRRGTSGGSGYSNLTDTLVNNSTVKSFSLNNRGGSTNNSRISYIDTQGVDGHNGGQVFFIATLTAGTVYTYTVGAGGGGGSYLANYNYGSGASGENGFLTINY